MDKEISDALELLIKAIGVAAAGYLTAWLRKKHLLTGTEQGAIKADEHARRLEISIRAAVAQVEKLAVEPAKRLGSWGEPGTQPEDMKHLALNFVKATLGAVQLAEIAESHGVQIGELDMWLGGLIEAELLRIGS
jgi:hypothetical protein